VLVAAHRVGAGEKEAEPPLLERSREVALALSACPKHLAGGAAVYALEKRGYVKVREGQNGFTALVQRSLPNSVEPRCMDAEGTRTHLPRTLKMAELRAQGKTRQEIRLAVAEMYARGQLQPPRRAGVDYMLSTENVVPVDEERGLVAPYPPHLMFYVPYLGNADLGSDGNPTGPAFVVDEGTPYALLIVPVAPSRPGTETSPHQH